jgi:hypothetical protein
MSKDNLRKGHFKEHEIIDDDLKSGKSPLWYIIAFFIISVMIIAIFPIYSIRLDPHPKKIPTIDDIVPSLKITDINMTFNRGNFNQFLKPNDPLTKQSATKIATFGCGNNKICQAKSEFYFVRDNFIYVSEYDEYVQSPQEMLATRGGDCDDHAVLLANLMRSIGIYAEFVHVPRHVYVKIYLPEAPKKYLNEEGWIELDPTCKHCEFGEIPRKYWDN